MDEDATKTEDVTEKEDAIQKGDEFGVLAADFKDRIDLWNLLGCRSGVGQYFVMAQTIVQINRDHLPPRSGGSCLHDADGFVAHLFDQF